MNSKSSMIWASLTSRVAISIIARAPGTKRQRRRSGTDRVDIAIQAMSRLAFPVGWNDPTRLPSIADRVLAQVDKIDDPIKRAEVTINALGLRDVAGVWKAEDSCRAVAALAEIVQGGDLVQIASAQTIAARFRLRNAEYQEAISKFEESLASRDAARRHGCHARRVGTLLGFASCRAMGTYAIGRDIGRGARR